MLSDISERVDKMTVTVQFGDREPTYEEVLYHLRPRGEVYAEMQRTKMIPPNASVIITYNEQKTPEDQMVFTAYQLDAKFIRIQRAKDGKFAIKYLIERAKPTLQ